MRLLFVGLFLLLFSGSVAQKSQDYYVTAQGDMVYGTLKPNTSDYNLAKFKVEGADYQFLPEGTVAYYDSYMRAQYSLIKTRASKSEFLKEEVAGETRLYRSASAYFLLNPSDSVLKIDDRQLKIYEHRKSMADLKAFLSVCSILTDRDFKEAYDDQMQVRFSGLCKLITKSNQCGDPEKAVYKKKDSFTLFEVVALAGWGPVKPVMSNGDLFDYSNLDKTSTTQFAGRFRVGFPQRKNRLNIAIGYALSSFKTTGTESRLLNSSYRFDYAITLNMDLRELSFGVEYCIFLTPKFSIYPTIGHSMVTTSINELQIVATRTSLLTGNTAIADQRNVSDGDIGNKYDPSWFFGLGLEYNISNRLRAIMEFVQYTPLYVEFKTDQPKLEIQRNSLRVGLGFVLLK